MNPNTISSSERLKKTIQKMLSVALLTGVMASSLIGTQGIASEVNTINHTKQVKQIMNELRNGKYTENKFLENINAEKILNMDMVDLGDGNYIPIKEVLGSKKHQKIFMSKLIKVMSTKYKSNSWSNSKEENTAYGIYSEINTKEIQKILRTMGIKVNIPICTIEEASKLNVKKDLVTKKSYYITDDLGQIVIRKKVVVNIGNMSDEEARQIMKKLDKNSPEYKKYIKDQKNMLAESTQNNYQPK